MFGDFEIFVEEKCSDDWRVSCLQKGINEYGDEVFFGYRVYGPDKVSAIRNLADSLEKGYWDCEYPKEDIIDTE